MFYKLSFFKKGDSLCGADFYLPNEIEIINIKQVISISPLRKFNTPLSGNNVGIFAILRMVNNDIYHIDKISYEHLSSMIEKSTVC